MSEKATITAMREWLKTCPLIAEEQTENGAAFRISGLSPEPVAEFSIEDSPTDPVLTTYFSGRNMAKSYAFLSRREYSEAQSTQIANSGFFEQLTDWVLAQNDRHNLPQLEAPKQPLSVSVTASGYIVTSSAGSCTRLPETNLASTITTSINRPNGNVARLKYGAPTERRPQPSRP